MTSSIPSVAGQVATWRRVTTEPEKPGRERAAWADLEVRGNIGRSFLATMKDGRSLKLKGPVQPFAIAEARPEAIEVTRTRRSADGRQIDLQYLGTPLEADMFERLLRKQKKTYTPKDRPPHPIDAHAHLRGGMPRQIVRLGSAEDSDQAIARDIMSKRPGVLFTNGAAPLTSIAQELAHWQRRGVAIAASADRRIS